MNDLLYDIDARNLGRGILSLWPHLFDFVRDADSGDACVYSFEECIKNRLAACAGDFSSECGTGCGDDSYGPGGLLLV